ncbi:MULTISPECIES: hypothetical protein [unclassified Halomonas]|uniref:hypothetical protein n=1 Tax=unclassified Halomonas TaxID=2609666 RepID=UPI004034DA70
MGRWLSRVQASGGDVADASPHVQHLKSTGQPPPQTPKSPLRGLGGEVQGAFSKNNAPLPPDQERYKPATPAEIATIISGLKAVGRSLGLVEALAREAMAQLTREAAAELAVVLDDVFEVAPDDTTAHAHCRRLLNDQEALAAAKAVWPSLPPTLAAIPQQAQTNATASDDTPSWLRLIRQHCALVPEDERLLTRCLGMRASQDALQAARRYVTTWQQAASAEPREAARDNAGRRAANQILKGRYHSR